MADLRLAHLPTPLERADRLGVALALPPGRLWVKRDDCTGLATGTPCSASSIFRTDRVVFSHGGVVSDPGAAIRQLLGRS